jgi:hypothetical protein
MGTGSNWDGPGYPRADWSGAEPADVKRVIVSRDVLLRPGSVRGTVLRCGIPRTEQPVRGSLPTQLIMIWPVWRVGYWQGDAVMPGPERRGRAAKASGGIFNQYRGMAPRLMPSGEYRSWPTE